MTFEELERLCRRDIARSRGYSRALPAWSEFGTKIAYAIPIVIAIAAVAIFSFPLSLSLGMMAYGIFRGLLLLHAASFEQADPNRWDDLPDVTEDLEDSDRLFITRVCTECGLDPARLRVVSHLKSAETAPSVAQGTKRIYLILPPAFFDIWQSEPAAAEAMIAHELGHVLQRDVDLYVDFQRIMRFIIRRYLPVMGVLSVIVIAGTAYLMVETAGELDRRMWGWMFGLSYFSHFDSFRNVEFWISLSGLAVIATTVFMLLYIAVLTLIFRTLNHRSEALCDRIALTLTGTQGIHRSLALFHQHPGVWSVLVPSLHWRRQKLDAVLRAIGSDARPHEETLESDEPRFKPRSGDFRPASVSYPWLLARLAIWSSLVLLLWQDQQKTARETPFGSETPRLHEQAKWPARDTARQAGIDEKGERVAYLDFWSDRVVVVDTRSGAELARVSVPEHGFGGARFSKDGRRLLVFGGDHSVQLHDAATGEKLDFHRTFLLAAAFASVGGIVTLSSNGNLDVWHESATLESAATKPRELPVGGELATFRADAEQVAVVSELGASLDRPRRRITVWNLRGDKLYEQEISSHEPFSLSLSADGKWLAYAAKGRSLILDLATGGGFDLSGSQMQAWLDDAERRVAFAPHATLLASQYDMRSDRRDHSLALYEFLPGPGGRSRLRRTKTPISLGLATSVEWSGDGRSILVVDIYGTVMVYGMPEGNPKFEARSGEIKSFAVTRSARFAAAIHDDDFLRVWSLPATESEQPALTFAHRFEGLSCVSAAALPDSIVVTHAAGRSVVSMPTGESVPATAGQQCEPADRSEFEFINERVHDKRRAWTFRVGERFEGLAVLQGPEADSFWHPRYRVLGFREHELVLAELVDGEDKRKSAQTRMSMWILLMLIFEFGLFVWRRHTAPY
jgi:WD40 repeat protein